MKQIALTATILLAPSIAFAQSEQPDAPAGAPAATETAPAAAPKAAPEKAPPPFSLGRADTGRPGKSPYATDTQFGHPPAVYVIPMEGFMGVDIHPVVYDRILKDVKEKKPDLIVFRLTSSDGRMVEKYMEAMNEAMKDDRIDPRRLASGITDYRDLAAKLHNELDQYPCVMYVNDARGVSCVYALAWPYMYMSPEARVAGLDIVGSLGGGNDADIKAKMFSAWTGIAKGILELGGRPQELSDALVRPDRRLSCDLDGRSTKWRSDTNGSWYVIDQSDEVSARFDSKAAEDTGLTDGIATDMTDLMVLLGYPEFTKVDSGERIYKDMNTAWRKKYAESKKKMEQFQEPVEDIKDLNNRRAILDWMQQQFKQSPQFAKMWEWTRGLTEDQLKLLKEQIDEQIRAANKQKQQQGSGGKSGGKGFGGGGLGGGGR